MQHAVGGPLPSPERPGPGPGPIPAGGHGPVPPAPQSAPYPGPPSGVPGGRLGVHPAVQPGPPQAAPGGAPWGAAPGAVPPHPPGAIPPHATGAVPLAPPVPVVEHRPGTGGATLAVLLIGPAGAGKTTVARHWATRRPVPTAHISLDDVREWVCSGFADPQSGWNEHSEAQYRLARRTCGFAARNFLANGISCILDDAVFPDRPVVGLGGWKRHVGPGLLPVVLLPGLEVVLERNAQRAGNRRLSDEEVAAIHGRMAGWYGSGLPIIDNSALDVDSTARLIDEALARAIAAPPTG
ncbi:ATP-binding protein [Streptomyces sp. R302]|uniref:AAA family ATPase n=1 Tax=unclassified Streptomyces TaxID=2593676 RepID=UPI00145D097B|nr:MULTISPECIES: AAA family ATPase [unclassified Streptomyces]NML53601.1 ATP-binding protein [Streptomyces sp. R301]NML81962.1 ATP-binding protein [Streptomyces sp. R302]